MFDGVIGDQSRDVTNASTKDEMKAMKQIPNDTLGRYKILLWTSTLMSDDEAII